jgi:hypothetical protein
VQQAVVSAQNSSLPAGTQGSARQVRVAPSPAHRPEQQSAASAHPAPSGLRQAPRQRTVPSGQGGAPVVPGGRVVGGRVVVVPGARVVVGGGVGGGGVEGGASGHDPSGRQAVGQHAPAQQACGEGPPSRHWAPQRPQLKRSVPRSRHRADDLRPHLVRPVGQTHLPARWPVAVQAEPKRQGGPWWWQRAPTNRAAK